MAIDKRTSKQNKKCIGHSVAQHIPCLQISKDWNSDIDRGACFPWKFWRRIYIWTHSGCWQKIIPCDNRMEVTLLTIGSPFQLPEACLVLHGAPYTSELATVHWIFSPLKFLRLHFNTSLCLSGESSLLLKSHVITLNHMYNLGQSLHFNIHNCWLY